MTPPIGSTRPERVISPVIEMSCRTGRPERADTSTVAMVTPAEGPSLATQFGPKEDLARYPRDTEGDRAKCESAGVDLLFMPEAQEMYPDKPSVFVGVEGISDVLEGAVRPGHFRGVATVVAKLFHIVKPRSWIRAWSE